jgi:hypothetical protein
LSYGRSSRGNEHRAPAAYITGRLCIRLSMYTLCTCTLHIHTQTHGELNNRKTSNVGPCERVPAALLELEALPCTKALPSRKLNLRYPMPAYRNAPQTSRTAHGPMSPCCGWGWHTHYTKNRVLASTSCRQPQHSTLQRAARRCVRVLVRIVSQERHCQLICGHARRVAPPSSRVGRPG